MLMDGFWLGVGFWAATVAVFVFVIVVTAITSFILGILDHGKGKTNGSK